MSHQYMLHGDRLISDDISCKLSSICLWATQGFEVTLKACFVTNVSSSV